MSELIGTVKLSGNLGHSNNPTHVGYDTFGLSDSERSQMRIHYNPSFPAYNFLNVFTPVDSLIELLPIGTPSSNGDANGYIFEIGPDPITGNIEKIAIELSEFHHDYGGGYFQQMLYLIRGFDNTEAQSWWNDSGTYTNVNVNIYSPGANQTLNPSVLSLSSQIEEVSDNFGVSEDVSIEQTIYRRHDAFRGRNIDTSSVNFQNTSQGFSDSNDDGRVELGLFFFDDQNIADDNFADVLGPPFKSIDKQNLVTNGDCKFVEKNLLFGNGYFSGYALDEPLVVIPEGGWDYIPLFGLMSSHYSHLGMTTSDFYQEITHSAYPGLNQYKFDEGYRGYTGVLDYVPLSLEITGSSDSYEYWNEVKRTFHTFGTEAYYQFKYWFDAPSQGYIEGQFYQGGIYSDQFRNDMDITYQHNHEFGPSPGVAPKQPRIAHWVNTDEAYSNGRCLRFQNFQIWNNWRVNYWANGNPSPLPEPYVWNWLLKPGLQTNGVKSALVDESDSVANTDRRHQYRVLNQMQKIYDKFNDEPINPYSSLKIRFKMKTTHALPFDNSWSTSPDALNQTLTPSEIRTKWLNDPLDKDIGYAPKIEVGITPQQFNEIPVVGASGISQSVIDDMGGRDNGYGGYLTTAGSFNSLKYPFGTNLDEQRNQIFGGINRFQNSVMGEWETYEFVYNLNEKHNNTGKIYGVPYGGSFDDVSNGGATEIMINHNFADDMPSFNVGEIFFKVPGYQEPDTADRPNEVYMFSPSGTRVLMRHGARSTEEYMTVVSALGDATYGNQTTGLQDDGTVIEAYLMYIGTLDLLMDTDSGVEYGDAMPPDNEYNTADVVVAYWDGRGWTWDNNQGYDKNRRFAPDNNCFILGRLYADLEDDGISGMDQYINNESEFLTTGVENLFLTIQSGNDFHGTVLIDDIECFESYEFIPDVDVRKKLSVGNFGKADLTKYYDKDLQPDEYKDSTAPLEAQFYFYPTYPTNEIFDIIRTPIYQDFRLGRFYLYDVDWGDGSTNEFSTPKQIDENTAVYHTYESYGIFEVTGTMLRVKVDNNGNINGVAYNKRFNLRININEGTDEDFKFFGSDGYSFIPFKNTTPVIGGISNQSNYYKTIKRQLGFLDNEKISIEFKNKSDKLKTELALLKMENQNLDDLEILPAYLEEKRILGPVFPINYVGSSQTLGNAIAIANQWPSTIPVAELDQYWLYGSILSTGLDLFLDSMTPTGFLNPETSGFTDTNGIFVLWADNMSLWFQIYPFFEQGAITYLQATNQDIPQYEDEVIYNGITPIKEELGKGIGDCDLTSIKYYNKPQSIWEMFGFQNEDLLEVGKPNNIRYWNNIISQTHPFFHREGLVDFSGVSYNKDILNQYDVSEATTTFENSPLGFVESGTPPGVDGWYGNNFDERFGVCEFPQLPGVPPESNISSEVCEIDGGGTFRKNWSMEIIDINDLPGYQKAIRVVTKYDENSHYADRSWGGFYRSFIVDDNIPTMFGGWFKVLNGGMEYGALNTQNKIMKTPDYGNSNNGWEFFVSPLHESDFNSDSEGNGCHFYSWVTSGYPDGEVLIAGLFAFNNEEFYTELESLVEGGLGGDIPDYNLGLNVYSLRDKIDTYSQQAWLGTNNHNNPYYYPVLPRLGQDGKFIDGDFGTILMGAEQIPKIPFPTKGKITDEDEQNENLLINISTEKKEVDVFNDKSGNKNNAFNIQDYKPEFEDSTLRVEKNTDRKIFKSSIKNGAF